MHMIISDVCVCIRMNRGICLAVILISTFAKFIPAFFMTRWLTKESWRFCSTVGILMNTRGLVELIALNVALQFVSSYHAYLSAFLDPRSIEIAFLSDVRACLAFTCHHLSLMFLSYARKS